MYVSMCVCESVCVCECVLVFAYMYNVYECRYSALAVCVCVSKCVYT